MTSEVVYIRGTVTQDKRGKRRRGGLISFQAAHNQTGLLQVIKPPPKKRDTKKVGRASLINSRGPWNPRAPQDHHNYFQAKTPWEEKTGKSPDTRQGAGPPWLILGGHGTPGPHATTTPSTQFT